MRYHLELVRRAIIKREDKCWRGYGEKGGNVNWAILRKRMHLKN